ncbi:MAG: HEPN domain-containing protein [Flavobacteriaceae bacterium]|nr:HEPN domain-containing protein [Flavobacteriaceae bacterium]
MDKKQKTHFERAKEKLQLANNELFKPEEDVVSYSVCKNSQYAIEAYLKGYIKLSGFETHDNETIEGLLNRCIELDGKFRNIDLNVINCKKFKIDSRYCTDVSKVSSCFDAADSIDTLLRQMKVV